MVPKDSKKQTKIPTASAVKNIKDIVVQEKLGGGQFSEVYKGIWMVKSFLSEN
jgi:hypothetical protein